MIKLIETLKNISIMLIIIKLFSQHIIYLVENDLLCFVNEVEHWRKMQSTSEMQFNDAYSL